MHPFFFRGPTYRPAGWRTARAVAATFFLRGCTLSSVREKSADARKQPMPADFSTEASVVRKTKKRAVAPTKRCKNDAKPSPMTYIAMHTLPRRVVVLPRRAKRASATRRSTSRDASQRLPRRVAVSFATCRKNKSAGGASPPADTQPVVSEEKSAEQRVSEAKPFRRKGRVRWLLSEYKGREGAWP